MKNINILFAALIMAGMLQFVPNRLFAQQDAMISQYMFNELVLNPSYAGVRKNPVITGAFRKQWTSMVGAPVSQTLSYDQKFNDKMAFGVLIANDNIGVTGQTDFFADYAYILKLNNKMNLSFGLRGGVSNYRASLTELLVWDGDDDSFTQDLTKKWIPNFGTGAYLHHEKFYAGISLPKMLNYDPSTFLHLDINQAPQLKRHFYFTGGYDHAFNDMYSVRPSVLFKYVSNAPGQIDINLLGYYKKMFGVGVSYRSKNAMVAMLEFQAKKNFKVGYSFDYTFKDLGQYTSGSHEIMLTYSFDKEEAASAKIED